MARYVALLRGIGPGNPNMRGNKFKMVFESLGFTNVAPVISSGNVVFDSRSINPKLLEAKIEKALPAQLGFKSMTVVRSQAYLEKLAVSDPFKKAKGKKRYLVVTFFKHKPEPIYNAIDLARESGTDFMRRIEKEHGKEITTRTWGTVGRILKKMGSDVAVG